MTWLGLYLPSDIHQHLLLHTDLAAQLENERMQHQKHLVRITQRAEEAEINAACPNGRLKTFQQDLHQNMPEQHALAGAAAPVEHAASPTSAPVLVPQQVI